MYWKISNLTKEMSRILGEEVSVKTVERWFRKLEKEEIHFITRSEETGDRVFDDMDLQIALFIKEKRNENWLMAAIFGEIKKKFETRPFPLIEETSLRISDENKPLSQDDLINELKSAFAEVAVAELENLKNQYKEHLHIMQLPKPTNNEDRREKRFQEMVLRKRIEYQLEKEALMFWNAKPKHARLRRIGLFKKEEDWEKRDLFIRDYVYEHFEERLKKELIDWNE